MSNFHSNDPRAIRTRQAFQEAFKELLNSKPFQKITVTDIAERAGFARHTFYNHYETKEDILNCLIDSILDKFFSSVDRWDFYLADPEEELSMYTSFFQVWKENVEIVKLLNKIDIDVLLIERLKTYFTKFFYERVSKEVPDVDLELAKYIINFNAYTMLGILKPWLKDEMRHPPEVMAGFLIQLTGAAKRKQTVEIYKNIITS
ncbi:TetR/AcrR family transcriptional regulator [Chloroflexota bacterium]